MYTKVGDIIVIQLKKNYLRFGKYKVETYGHFTNCDCGYLFYLGLG